MKDVYVLLKFFHVLFNFQNTLLLLSTKFINDIEASNMIDFRRDAELSNFNRSVLTWQVLTRFDYWRLRFIDNVCLMPSIALFSFDDFCRLVVRRRFGRKNWETLNWWENTCAMVFYRKYFNYHLWNHVRYPVLIPSDRVDT